MNLWNSKEKAPGAAEGEEEAFYCLAAGFFSSFPLAAVFIESRCSMIAPGKYHMRTHRESQLQVYGGGSVVCPGSGPQVTALLLPPTPNSRPLSAPLNGLRCSTTLWQVPEGSHEPSDMGSINFYTIASFSTHLKNFSDYMNPTIGNLQGFFFSTKKFDQSLCPFLKVGLYYCFYSILFSVSNWGSGKLSFTTLTS